MSTSDKIIKRIQSDNGRFWAGDNISKYLESGDKDKLIEELTPKFESVLDGLIIDRHNDPNSMDTGRRLAKMYINELMSGRMIQCRKQLHFLIIYQMVIKVCWLLEAK